MNTSKFIITSLVVFVGMFALDFLFHAIYMVENYKSIASIMRPEADQMSYFPALLLGQLFISVGFVYVFIKGREGKGIGEGIRYGLIIGLAFGVGPSIINYAIYPISGTIMLNYFFWYPIECMILGALASVVYKP